MQAGASDELARKRCGDDDAIGARASDRRPVVRTTRLHDRGGARLRGDGDRLDQRSVGQGAGHMDQNVDRANPGAKRAARTDAFAVRQAHRGEAGGFDVLDELSTEMMPADVARRHEGQRVGKTGLGELVPQEDNGITSGRRSLSCASSQTTSLTFANPGRSRDQPSVRCGHEKRAVRKGGAQWIVKGDAGLASQGLRSSMANGLCRFDLAA